MSEYIEFLDGKKYPAKNAARSPFHDKFKDAGYLLSDADLVIDIDCLEKKKIEKIISFFGIKTQIVWTERGAHFYFKKPETFNKGNKAICSLGFEIEYKHKKNTPNGLTIKQEWNLREIENEGFREELPDIFKYKRGLKSLLGMGEAEGRNRDLFAHRMKIQDLSQWKSILRFINNHVFAVPMDEKEFETIARDGVKPKAEKDNHHEIADYLIKKYKVVSYLGTPYWYINGHFISDSEVTNRVIAEEVPNQNTRFYKEIIGQMQEFKVPTIPNEKVFDIKLQNGILSKGKFIKTEYEEFTPYAIPLPYLDDAKEVKEVDDYLNHLSQDDPNYKQRLLEIMGHCFITDPAFKGMLAKMFIIIGEGGRGKGTFLKILKEILSEKNCSSLSIKQMAEEKYLHSISGKLVNLADDLDDEYITKSEAKILKNISTCDYISIRKLYGEPRSVILTPTLIFTSNHLLKSQEKGDSWKRRLDWLPIDRTPPTRDPDFFSKVTSKEALHYWMKLMVEAYLRIYKNKGFTPCKIIDDFNGEYHLFNDNITQFLNEHNSKEYWIGKGKRETYDQYLEWCAENHEKPQRKDRLYDQIKKGYKINFGTKMIKKGTNWTSTTCFYE